MLRHKRQIRPHLPAVEDRDFQHVAGGDLNLIQLAHQPFEPFHQHGVTDDAGVIVDGERAVGGNCLHNAGDSALLQGDVKRPDAGVDCLADLIAEFHGQRGVACQQKADLL